MAFDLKSATPDTTFPAGGFLFGADSQSAANPSVYDASAYLNYILGLANTWTLAQTHSAAINLAAGGSIVFTADNTAITGNDSTIIGLREVGQGPTFFVRTNTLIAGLRSDAAFGFSPSTNPSSLDTTVYRDAANIWAQRSGTNAQTTNVYNTFTSLTNNELFAIDWATAANICNLWTKKGSGGGTARALQIGTDGTGRWQIGATSGHLLAVADGTYDIGDGTTDPRKIYLDQTVTAGGTTGNQTINKAAGTVNIAAAGTTVTVTNSLCTTSSIVHAVLRTNDATAAIQNVVPGSGSFVITLTAAATAEVSIGFWVLN